MPGLMGNSKWTPGGENDKDDDNGNNRDNRRNNNKNKNNGRAPPKHQHTGNRKNNAPQYQHNVQDWKKGKTPAPAYGTGSRRAPGQHGRHLNDGGLAPPKTGHIGNDVGYGEYGRPAAMPPAGYSPSNYLQGPNLAVQPGYANAPMPSYGANSYRMPEQPQHGFNEGGGHVSNDVEHGFGRHSALSPAAWEKFQQRAIVALQPADTNAAVPVYSLNSRYVPQQPQRRSDEGRLASPVPACNARPNRVSEEPRRPFDDGRLSSPVSSHAGNDEYGHGKSAASPAAARAPSTTHSNLAVQPAHATPPVPKLKKSAVIIVGSASVASPVMATAPVGDAVEESSTTSVPRINITPASATTSTAPSGQMPPAAPEDVAAPTPASFPVDAPAPMAAPTPENNAPPAAADATPTATQEPTPAQTSTPSNAITGPVHPFANTTFCIPPQGPLSDADFTFLMFKLCGRQISAQDWAIIAQQVLGATFGQPIVTIAAENAAVPVAQENEDVSGAHAETSCEPHTPLPSSETMLTEEQVDEEEGEPVVVRMEQGERAGMSLDEEFGRLVRK